MAGRYQETVTSERTKVDYSNRIYCSLIFFTCGWKPFGRVYDGRLVKEVSLNPDELMTNIKLPAAPRGPPSRRATRRR